MLGVLHLRTYLRSSSLQLDPILRERVSHIVVMPTYKEPAELLVETISSVRLLPQSSW